MVARSCGYDIRESVCDVRVPVYVATLRTYEFKHLVLLLRTRVYDIRESTCDCANLACAVTIRPYFFTVQPVITNRQVQPPASSGSRQTIPMKKRNQLTHFFDYISQHVLIHNQNESTPLLCTSPKSWPNSNMHPMCGSGCGEIQQCSLST